MAKARAKQQPLTPRTRVIADAQRKLVGNQKDRGKAELAALRETIKAQARISGGDNKLVQRALARISKEYGDAETQRAIREFNLSFKGIQRDPEEGKNPRHG